VALDGHGVTHWIAERLLEGSLEGAAVVALVWLVCHFGPRMPASVHAALWWLVALKLVLTLLPVPALSVPVLPAPSAAVASIDIPAPAELPRATSPSRTPGAKAAAPGGQAPLPWRAWAITLWCAVLAAQVLRLAASLRTMRRLVRRAGPCDEDDALVVSRVATTIGLTHAPSVRVSDEIAAPQVVGLWRPTVLLPRATASALSAAERRMAIGHELMHVRRHDLVLGWVPALAERLFFFHPLARLTAREYLTSREAACDAAVLRTLDVPAADYGRLLLRLGVGGGEPFLTAGGSSSSASSLKRRLDMLQHADFSHRLAWCLAALTLAAVVPFELSARPASSQAPAATAPVPVRVEIQPAPTAAPVPVRQQAPTAAPVPVRQQAVAPIPVQRQAVEPVPVQRAAPAPAPVPSPRPVEAQEPEEAARRDADRREVEAGLRALRVETEALAARGIQVREAARGARELAEAASDARAASLEEYQRLMQLSIEMAALQQRLQPATAGVGVSVQTPFLPSRDALLRDQRILSEQLREMARSLAAQQQEIARQQERMVTMQQQIAEQNEQLREALERALASIQSDLQNLRRPE
jgi:beta-lactamase regulating signal transducer with metallopeptidase domain